MVREAMARGLEFSSLDLRETVKALLDSRGRVTRFLENRPSKSWVALFLSRNSGIRLIQRRQVGERSQTVSNSTPNILAPPEPLSPDCIIADSSSSAAGSPMVNKKVPTSESIATNDLQQAVNSYRKLSSPVVNISKEDLQNVVNVDSNNAFSVPPCPSSQGAISSGIQGSYGSNTTMSSGQQSISISKSIPMSVSSSSTVSSSFSSSSSLSSLATTTVHSGVLSYPSITTMSDKSDGHPSISPFAADFALAASNIPLQSTEGVTEKSQGSAIALLKRLTMMNFSFGESRILQFFANLEGRVDSLDMDYNYWKNLMMRIIPLSMSVSASSEPALSSQLSSLPPVEPNIRNGPPAYASGKATHPSITPSFPPSISSFGAPLALPPRFPTPPMRSGDNFDFNNPSLSSDHYRSGMSSANPFHETFPHLPIDDDYQYYNLQQIRNDDYSNQSTIHKNYQNPNVRNNQNHKFRNNDKFNSNIKQNPYSKNSQNPNSKNSQNHYSKVNQNPYSKINQIPNSKNSQYPNSKNSHYPNTKSNQNPNHKINQNLNSKNSHNPNAKINQDIYPKAKNNKNPTSRINQEGETNDYTVFENQQKSSIRLPEEQGYGNQNSHHPEFVTSSRVEGDWYMKEEIKRKENDSFCKETQKLKGVKRKLEDKEKDHDETIKKKTKTENNKKIDDFTVVQKKKKKEQKSEEVKKKDKKKKFDIESKETKNPKKKKKMKEKQKKKEDKDKKNDKKDRKNVKEKVKLGANDSKEAKTESKRKEKKLEEDKDSKSMKNQEKDEKSKAKFGKKAVVQEKTNLNQKEVSLIENLHHSDLKPRAESFDKENNAIETAKGVGFNFTMQSHIKFVEDNVENKTVKAPTMKQLRAIEWFQQKKNLKKEMKLNKKNELKKKRQKRKALKKTIKQAKKPNKT